MRFPREGINHTEPTERSKSDIEAIEPRAFSILTNREWRHGVLERVDQLIEQIKDNNIEELIFLDKSARPLSWLLGERLKHKNPKYKFPKIKYIDLGLREKKGDRLGAKTIVEQLSEEANSRYLALDEDKQAKYSDDNDWSTWKKIFFAQGDNVEREIWMSRKHISELWRDTIRQHPELIDQLRARYGNKLGKTLIIDDLLFSGGTLRTAVTIFTEAYPESDIYGVHFLNQETRSPETRIPWFKKPHMIGVEEEEGSLTTKRFSAQKPQKPDLSRELREIIKEIGQSDINE